MQKKLDENVIITRYEVQVNMIFTFIFMKKCNSINVAVLDVEILHANRFSTDLVHRRIIFPLTLLLLEKLMITSPDNTL